jgi:carboxyl-terminal processing protease
MKLLRSLRPLFGLAFVLAPWVLQGSLQLSVEDRRSMQRETKTAINVLQELHLKKLPFVEIDSVELLTEYMNRLDEQRLFFLETDHEAMVERFERTLKPSYLFVGDLFPAFEIFALYRDRVEDRLDWIAGRLKEDFDLTTDATINLERKDQPWPADRAAADVFWEKRLKADLIAELLEEETLENALTKIGNRYERRRKFLAEFEPHNVQETFLSTLTALYDPHSSFFSWDSAQEFDIEISNSLIGIGAQLRDVEGYCVIERVLPGGPAEQSGEIHPGDRIVAVAQGANGEPVDVVGMKLRRVVHMIRGEIGTTLQLTIQPPGGDNRRTVTIVRDRIELAANLANGRIFHLPRGDETIPIGVIELPSFYGEGDFGGTGTSTTADVRELIEKLSEYEIEGLVLDLRHNGGGRLDEAVRLTGLFIENGPVVMKRSYDGQISEDWDEDPGVAYEGPLVVLTSRMSASASEIMAGALKSYQRAVIVGDQSTYGKGTVQTLVDLKRMSNNPFWKPAPQWGMLKLTIQQFYLPDGVSTQELGVASHIVLPSLTESLIETEGTQPYALAWDQISPISFDQVEASWKRPVTTIDERLLAELSQRSSHRQETLAEFDLQHREMGWRGELIEQEVFSLNLAQRETDKVERETMSRAFEEERKRLGRELAITSDAVELKVAAEQEALHQAKLRETPLPDGKPRANRLFQKVFYYQAEPGEKIHEIWVEYVDYDDMLQHTAELAQTYGEALGGTITEAQMDTILRRLKNEDRLTHFNVLAPFRDVLGADFAEAELEAGLAAFFRKMIELDEDILRDRPVLDVHLRESMRIVSDWIDLAGEAERKTALAAALPASERTAEATN